jgi:4-diphosphocytidyl-2-C-methyl-D-erythritol kinase
VDLGGRPLLVWAVAALLPCVDEVVVAVADADLERARAAIAPLAGAARARVVRGGATRQATVAALLAAVDAEVVVVHDAARPFLDAATVLAALRSAREHGACSVGQPVADSLSASRRRARRPRTRCARSRPRRRSGATCWRRPRGGAPRRVRRRPTTPGWCGASGARGVGRGRRAPVQGDDRRRSRVGRGRRRQRRLRGPAPSERVRVTPPSAQPVRREAPAKLNLGLRVVGRRPDGFHELDSLFVRLEFADVVTLRVAAGADHDRLTRVAAGDPWLDGRPLGTGPDNLVLRAISAYRAAARAHGVALPPLEVDLRQAHPLGRRAGRRLGGRRRGATGGGGAVARRRRPAGPRRGSRLRRALLPRRRAGGAGRGRGETIAPRSLPPLDVVLVYPGVEVATGPAFGWWATDGGDVPPPTRPALRAGRRPPAGTTLSRPPVAARVPAVAEALAALRALAIGPVAMSGSGSTCFALAPDADAAAAAAAALARRATPVGGCARRPQRLKAGALQSGRRPGRDTGCPRSALS